jgi:hypothetical protein
MNQPSRQLLTKLLQSWQGNPGSTRKVRLRITPRLALPYFEATLPDEKEALHAALFEAAAAGCISLEWGKGFESHILWRITLEDGVALARYLGIPLAAIQAEEARYILEKHLSGGESWVNDWVRELLDHWSRNKSLNGIAPGDVATAGALVKTLEAVAAGRQRNLDLRTFSTRELGASKAAEAILHKFASVWKRYHPGELSNDELFETLGLLKFQQPLLLRGPIVLRLARRDLDCAGVEPYLGLPPQAVLEVLADKRPDYCLTIENLSSFNRYTAEVDDRGLVIFTSGFPSPGLVEFLQKLDNSLPGAIPFFHWGDIDEGGLRILSYISGIVKREVQPHLMTPELLAQKGQQSPDLRQEELRALATRNRSVAPLAEAILATDPPAILEQENTDPQPPKIADFS